MQDIGRMNDGDVATCASSGGSEQAYSSKDQRQSLLMVLHRARPKVMVRVGDISLNHHRDQQVDLVPELAIKNEIAFRRSWVQFHQMVVRPKPHGEGYELISTEVTLLAARRMLGPDDEVEVGILEDLTDEDMFDAMIDQLDCTDCQAPAELIEHHIMSFVRAYLKDEVTTPSQRRAERCGPCVLDVADLDAMDLTFFMDEETMASVTEPDRPRPIDTRELAARLNCCERIVDDTLRYLVSIVEGD